MERYVCIHGHFYQPPRENPWLEDIELQDSAYPYHDWNARINAECYGPNAGARILDNDRIIVEIINNYQKISFNFGPTLLSWMKVHAPEEYQNLIEADKETIKRYSGHGSAIAQCYNHIIMPLANSYDKRTQVIWGIRDFKSHFKREPEGMWLPETAVDIETLEIMAEFGIKFTILVSRQASQVRKIGETNWSDVKDEKIEPKRPYLYNLPSGKKIALFFSDKLMSYGVSGGDLLQNGENFANSIIGAFVESKDKAQLVHLATDGETFGHHHKHAEMALAYCLRNIESKNRAKITNYAEYLEKFPPEYEVKIFENSSWSCIHGVERWRSDCGCNSGGHPQWNQKWRKPLRDAMNFVRDACMPLYEHKMSNYAEKPWDVRNEYIDVILDRSKENVDKFLGKFSKRQLTNAERIDILKLLELQRHCMLMYTSCGWFFDEISGIETVQVMQYAARVMQLAQVTADIKLEDSYKKIIEKAPSNINVNQNGANVYDRYVQPTAIDLHRVGAHYAISSLFAEYPATANIYCYTVTNKKFKRLETGALALVIGRTLLGSTITTEEYNIDFAVLHLFEHNIYGGVSGKLDDESFENMNKEMEDAFSRADISMVISIMTKYLGRHNYSLWFLFKDEQRKILNQIYKESVPQIEFAMRYIYERYYPLMVAMREMQMPMPKALLYSAEFILNNDLIEEIQKDDTNISNLEKAIRELQHEPLELDKTTMAYVVSGKINALMKQLYKNPENNAPLEKLGKLVQLLKDIPLDLEIWKAQNMCFDLWKKAYDRICDNAKKGEKNAENWVKDFNVVSKYLNVGLKECDSIHLKEEKSSPRKVTVK